MIPTATATLTRTDRCAELLSALVSIDTSNPMGSPVHRSTPIEREAIRAIERLFEPHCDKVTLTRQSCSPIHENLIITWDVNSDRRPALFESHIDTVPANGWAEQAFSPRIVGDRLIGLGACDDKGCLAAMIVALLELLEQPAEPPRSIILVCAGDEEYAQTGIHRFLEEFADRPAYGVFGEPTRLCPVVQHKGTVRWDITVHGRSAHTSRPELGINAITGMMDVIAELRLYQEMLQTRSTNPLLTGPTITVTRIAGGRTRNAMPDECTIALDFRVVPGMDPAKERDAMIEHLTSLPWKISHGPVQLMTPPLDTDPDSPISQRLLSICRELVDPQTRLQGAPYGTDAAWVGHRCPAIVLGPGDIRHAHAVDEQISLSELATAVKVYKRMMREPFEQLP
jgi:acetylornithine deacetylase/succinyl-diaminopimelate desuccinylase-like protein